MGHEQTTTPPPSGSSDREPVPAGPAAGPDECDVVVEGPAGGPPSSGGGSGVVSARAIARFEFEESKGNEGTKVLLVEWDASSPSSSSGNKDEASENTGDWEIAWEGKTTVLPAVDATLAGPGGTPSSWRRVFFLLPPGAPVPPLVTISRTRKPGASDANADEPTETLRATPLPAIFVPALGVSSRDVGRRGVLHTIWAKRRLAELEREVDAEMRANGESVGLEMALQERRWILEHFGLGEPSAPSASTPDNQAQQSQQPLPQSPRSPISGRLGEKLKGLKLATSPADLTPAHSGMMRPQPADSSSSISAHANPPRFTTAPRLPDISPTVTLTGAWRCRSVLLRFLPGPTACCHKRPHASPGCSSSRGCGKQATASKCRTTSRNKRRRC